MLLEKFSNVVNAVSNVFLSKAKCVNNTNKLNRLETTDTQLYVSCNKTSTYSNIPFLLSDWL